jgi:hypothetical protein
MSNVTLTTDASTQAQKKGFQFNSAMDMAESAVTGCADRLMTKNVITLGSKKMLSNLAGTQ